MKRFFQWLVISSVDPTKVSLTVKGFLTTAVSVIVMVSPLFHLHIGSEQLTSIVDGIVDTIVVVLTALSSIVTLFGLIRKIVVTRNS